MKASWSLQEDQRAMAKANAEFNTRAYRAKNKQYSGLNINNRGDSSITADCPNGDGWASVDLMDENGTTKVALKCSTASFNIGCMLKSDFASRSYANQDGTCNLELPVPLPKIAK